MNDIKQLYRAAPGLVVTVGSMLAVGVLLGIVAVLVS